MQKKPITEQSVKSKSKKAVKDIIRTPLESIDECKGVSDKYYKKAQRSYVDNSLDKEGRNPACEKVIMLKERIGQDQHNQTVEEADNGENPIKCNVVSN